MSTDGLCLERDYHLSEGMPILMFISWPVRNEYGAEIEVVCAGRILRIDKLGAGVKFSLRPFFLRRDTNATLLQLLAPPGHIM